MLNFGDVKKTNTDTHAHSNTFTDANGEANSSKYFAGMPQGLGFPELNSFAERADYASFNPALNRFEFAT